MTIDIRRSRVRVMFAALLSSTPPIATAWPAAAQPTRSTDGYTMTHYFDLTGDPSATAMQIELDYRCWIDVRSRRCQYDEEDAQRIAIAIPGINKSVDGYADNGAQSGSYAIAQADVSGLFQPAANQVQGWVTAVGAGSSTWDGCTKFLKKIRKKNYARFGSSATVFARGHNGWQTGGLTWLGDWVASPTSAGERSIKDPVDARLTDHTTGTTSQWRLMSIRGFVHGGSLAWHQPLKHPPTLTNTAPEMEFEVVVDAPVIPVSERGRLKIEVRKSKVSYLDATGIFQYIDLQQILHVGGPGNFSFPFPAITVNYDLGGDPTHNLEVEFAMGGGAQGEDLVNAIGGCNLITDIANGFQSADTSMPRAGDADLGVSAERGLSRVADDFTIPAGPPLYLDAIDWPVYQTGAPAGVTVQAAYARIWQGNPAAGGVVYAGDMTTNRLIDVDTQPAVYRVERSDQKSTDRRVSNAVIDLSWVPALASGQYWIEVAFAGDPSFPATEAVPCSWGLATDNGLVYVDALQQWAPATDSLSGRPLDFVYRLYTDEEPPGCAADMNQDGVVDVADFVTFIGFFEASSPGADVTADGLIDFSDFLEYLNLYDVGC